MSRFLSRASERGRGDSLPFLELITSPPSLSRLLASHSSGLQESMWSVKIQANFHLQPSSTLSSSNFVPLDSTHYLSTLNRTMRDGVYFSREDKLPLPYPAVGRLVFLGPYPRVELFANFFLSFQNHLGPEERNDPLAISSDRISSRQPSPALLQPLSAYSS